MTVNIIDPAFRSGHIGEVREPNITRQLINNIATNANITNGKI